MGLTLYNTLTRSKQSFEPIDSERVTMYVCGPTVYNRVHIGNARPAVVFDTLFRVLNTLYPKVEYARNITDIDDKIMKTAAELGEDISALSTRYAQAYFDDMAALNNLSPTIVPYATQHIPEMIDMVARLIEKGHAYNIDNGVEGEQGHVLFAVQSMSDYGALSGRSLDDMLAGARVEVANYKKYAGDFVLWKPSADNEPGWDSPWGRGRPGWHLECSAMIEKHLGDSIDIHGGGQDLIFPHHENEIAQSRCVGHGFANIWMHNEMLQVEGKKMSKSLGNFFTVRDLLDQGVPGEVIRFVMLSTHYRKPMDWTETKRAEAERTLRGWHAKIEGVTAADAPNADVIEALADDLNTHKAIQALHDIARNGDPAVLKRSAQLLGLLSDEMDDWVAPSFGGGLDHEKIMDVESWLRSARNAAKLSGDFSEVDRLRSDARDAGLEVQMGKDTVELKPTSAFDADRLHSIKRGEA